MVDAVLELSIYRFVVRILLLCNKTKNVLSAQADTRLCSLPHRRRHFRPNHAAYPQGALAGGRGSGCVVVALVDGETDVVVFIFLALLSDR